MGGFLVSRPVLRQSESQGSRETGSGISHSRAFRRPDQRGIPENMAIDISPRFTLSRRGYATDEVDSYLESVTEHTTETDDQLADLQDQASYLEEENARLVSRIEELEDAINFETPHTVGALGERIKLILENAEEGANDALLRAKAEADYIVSEARKAAEDTERQAKANLAQSEETLSGSQRQADDLAERIESDARAKAVALLGEADLAAQRRKEQIETWAQGVIARTQADQSKMIQDFANVRRSHESAIRTLGVERDESVSALRALQLRINRAIEMLPETKAPNGAAMELAALAKASGEAPEAGEDPSAEAPAPELARTETPQAEALVVDEAEAVTTGTATEGHLSAPAPALDTQQEDGTVEEKWPYLSQSSTPEVKAEAGPEAEAGPAHLNMPPIVAPSASVIDADAVPASEQPASEQPVAEEPASERPAAAQATAGELAGVGSADAESAAAGVSAAEDPVTPNAEDHFKAAEDAWNQADSTRITSVASSTRRPLHFRREEQVVGSAGAEEVFDGDQDGVPTGEYNINSFYG